MNSTTEELRYCFDMIGTHGDDNVSHDPKTVASYLRLQAASMCRCGYYEMSARLGTAATYINEDARNSHAPRWDDAIAILSVYFPEG